MTKYSLSTAGLLLAASFVIAACASEPLDSNSHNSGGTGGSSTVQPPHRGGAASADCLGEGKSALGEPCPCATDCMAGLLCLSEADSGAPQGECQAGCTDDSGCPSEGGWYCFKFDETDALGICVQHCQTSNDCTSPDRHWCLFGDCSYTCERDSQCLSGHCNPGTFVCDDGAPNGDAPLLADCLRDEDCASGKCFGNPPTCHMPCPGDRDVCPAGTVCKNNGCHPLCKTTADCPAPWLCDTVLDDPSGELVCAYRDRDQTCTGVAASAGEPCGCDADCADGLPCQAPNSLGNTDPFGLCVQRCDFFHEGTGLRCPPDLHCIPNLDPNPNTNNNGVCVGGCDVPSDCKAGRVCSAERGCVPFCQSDADCAGTGKTPGADKQCNLYLGDCISFTPEGKTLGQACSDPAECINGWCISADDKDYFCSARCSIVGQKCPEGGNCVDYNDGDMGICLPSCKTSSDCPGGTTCVNGGCSR